MAADLTSNEQEMLSHLRWKYVVPDHGDFDDKIYLEVMLRNVAIRRGPVWPTGVSSSPRESPPRRRSSEAPDSGAGRP